MRTVVTWDRIWGARGRRWVWRPAKITWSWGDGGKFQAGTHSKSQRKRLRNHKRAADAVTVGSKWSARANETENRFTI